MTVTDIIKILCVVFSGLIAALAMAKVPGLAIPALALFGVVTLICVREGK